MILLVLEIQMKIIYLLPKSGDKSFKCFEPPSPMLISHPRKSQVMRRNNDVKPQTTDEISMRLPIYITRN